MKCRLNILITLLLTSTILLALSPINVKSEAQLNNSEIFDLLTEKTTQGGILDFLKAESEIKLNYDKSLVKDPLQPGMDYNIPINISYSISGMLADFYSKILKKSMATIDLSVESNEYCTASISADSINVNITSEETNIGANPEVTVVINSDAVARSDLKITVIAKAKEVKGPLGIFSWVKESDNVTLDISIQPEYVPLIEIKSDFDFKEIPPFNITELPVNITNNGNGKTKILIEALNVTKHFNLTYTDSIVLDIGETKQVIIEVEPDNDFGQETLEISFTPSYSEDTSLTGSSTIQTFVLKNDGSYKEDEELEIDISIIIILGFAILILLIFIYIIRNRL